MGLDVYKHKVDKNGEHTLTLYKDDTNKSKLALFEKYSEYVEDGIEVLYDFDAALQKKGKNPDEWEWLSTCCNDHTTITFVKIGAEERIVLASEEVPLSNEPVKRLRYTKAPYTKACYQRKQMKVGFYTDFLAGCWYVSEDTDKSKDDSVDYVLTQDDLDLAKTYCEEGAPMLGWVLGENEFVHFCY